MRDDRGGRSKNTSARRLLIHQSNGIYARRGKKNAAPQPLSLDRGENASIVCIALPRTLPPLGWRWRRGTGLGNVPDRIGGL